VSVLGSDGRSTKCPLTNNVRSPEQKPALGRECGFYLSACSGMHHRRTKKPSRTIRINVPKDIYARLAYLAATESASVPELARTALLQFIVNEGRIPLDDAAAMLNLQLGDGTTGEP